MKTSAGIPVRTPARIPGKMPRAGFPGKLRAAAIAAVLLLAVHPSPAGIRIGSMQGDVTVRHGAAEEWVAVAVGDVLRPEDSVRMGEGSSATITIDDGAGERRKVGLPPNVIVDIADLREMTRSDLLMKLAMEDVRSAPKKPSGGGGEMQKTTTTRAGDRDAGPAKQASAGSLNELRLNGARVLHDNGFYGPCVLRSREILRIEPGLNGRVDSRLLMADALEKMDLGTEAYGVYRSLAAEKLSADEQKLVEGKLLELRESPGSPAPKK